ncbi:hypothetical protein V6N12_039127 [Hibiscus sabdariffa]|uniref:Uncharacterized protein n=1 Tax=Hibiscus sabdariffa TaxID=183260 RepID=A0ABR2DZS2_9ROSI
MMMLGRGKEDLKSPETELSGDVLGKLNVFMTDSYEGLVPEEKVEEIMQELYKEITLATSSSNTSPPTTISESCGASMSESSSTVMAGIEFVGPTKKMHMPGLKGGSPEKELWIMDTGFEFDGKYDIINNNVVIRSKDLMKALIASSIFTLENMHMPAVAAATELMSSNFAYLHMEESFW